MVLFQKLLQRLDGLRYPQEYLCHEAESFREPLRIYLVENGRVSLDLTDLHSFVGYCPLIYAFSAAAIKQPSSEIMLICSPRLLNINEIMVPKDALALLRLKKLETEMSSPVPVFFYEGVEARHRFIPALCRAVIRLNNRLYGRKPGNVFLAGDLYQQVQVAYSLPRKVCLISLRLGELCNLFPTDLHGPLGDHHYLVSLRHEGKACAQVLAAGKLTLCEMAAASYRQVYALGKNHMQPPKPIDSFDFSDLSSAELDNPLPVGTAAYREMKLAGSFVHGIHRILLFRVLNREVVRPGSTLTHIHNVYASWRLKNGMESNYLLR